MKWPWVSRRPRPDPVGDLCRLLAEKPWEWVPFDPGFNDLKGYRHEPSGTELHWGTGVGLFPTNFVRLVCGGQPIALEDCDVGRVRAAVRASFVARAALRPLPFTASAVALAKAVLAGNHEAARALADEVFEHAAGGDPT